MISRIKKGPFVDREFDFAGERRIQVWTARQLYRLLLSAQGPVLIRLEGDEKGPVIELEVIRNPNALPAQVSNNGA